MQPIIDYILSTSCAAFRVPAVVILFHTNLLTHTLGMCVLTMSFSRIVSSFERISENFVDQENFTNITIREERLGFRGERVSFD